MKPEPSLIVELEINGVMTRAPKDQTIAALLIALDVDARGRTREVTSGGALCGIGSCEDCIVTVDGVARIKACLMPVREGMQILTRRKTP
ncbi:hypothetical protein A0W34_32415 (plasmid) [Rhodococcus sp. BH4]|uniref:(2Fe-2S)-binding protein n=1 Tax=Rhodococcus sp. BH4 TaxID=1807790 RepID=UPI0009C373FC|nr:(2Fe-2S)-binding protein [Rhodococcus sp. BH4]ARE38171.1 hypothetical protein A0W34_32415 [Rhodococcus sp. BH4]